MKDHPDWFFGGEVTDDGRYLVITVDQNDRTENALYVVDLAEAASPRLGGPSARLLDRFDARYTCWATAAACSRAHDLEAPRGRVVAIDLASPGARRLGDAGAQTADSIEDAGYVGGRLVVSTLHDVQSRLSAYAPDGSPARAVALPGVGA